MDKNIKDKVKAFLRKEGFYVVLLVVLCVLATVAVASMKNNNSSEDTTKEFSLDTKETNNQKQNAERVNNEEQSEVASNNETGVVSKEEETTPTSNQVEISFVNPLDGKMVRKYTYPAPIKLTENTYRNVKGIDIEAAIGTPVKVAAQGTVEEIGNQADEGVFVIVNHGNGLKTKYSNLDPTLSINKGDNVAADTVIGKVGESAKVLNNKLFGEHLNLQVMDTNGTQLDPTQYFKYEIK